MEREEQIFEMIKGMDYRLRNIEDKVNTLDYRLRNIESKVDNVSEDVKKVLKFVPVENADFDENFKERNSKKSPA